MGNIIIYYFLVFFLFCSLFKPKYRCNSINYPIMSALALSETVGNYSITILVILFATRGRGSLRLAWPDLHIVNTGSYEVGSRKSRIVHKPNRVHFLLFATAVGPSSLTFWAKLLFLFVNFPPSWL